MGRNATGVRGMNLGEKDYIVGMATTVKPGHVGAGVSPVQPSPGSTVEAQGFSPAKKSEEDSGALAPEVEDLGKRGSLILSVTENGYGKRTAADEYRLTNRGGKGVINVKTTERNGKVVGIAQVTEDAEVMLISQYGKIIRIESKFIRESGRSAQGVRLLNIEAGDRVAAAVVIPPEEEPTNGGTLIQ
jgi:DNA gyrase subunit A